MLETNITALIGGWDTFCDSIVSLATDKYDNCEQKDTRRQRERDQ